MVIQLVKKLQLRSIDHPILQPRSPIKKKKKRNCSIVQSDGNGSANLPIVDRIVSHHRYHRLHSSIREHTVEQSVPEKTTLPHLPFSHPPHLLTRLDFTWNESARSSRRWWRHSINRYINIISAFASRCVHTRASPLRLSLSLSLQKSPFPPFQLPFSPLDFESTWWRWGKGGGRHIDSVDSFLSRATTHSNK